MVSYFSQIRDSIIIMVRRCGNSRKKPITTNILSIQFIAPSSFGIVMRYFIIIIIICKNKNIKVRFEIVLESM